MSDPRLALFLTIFVIFPLLMISHEWGHKTMAERSGLKIKGFYVGIPLLVFVYRRVTERTRLKWLPVGVKLWYYKKVRNGFTWGFSPLWIAAGVKIDEASYKAASVKAKIATALGGPLANLMIAWLTGTVAIYQIVAESDPQIEIWKALVIVLMFTLAYILAGTLALFIAWLPLTAIPLITFVFFSPMGKELVHNVITNGGPVGQITFVSTQLSQVKTLGETMLYISLLFYGIAWINCLFVPALDGGPDLSRLVRQR